MNSNTLNDFFSDSILNNVCLSGSSIKEKITNYIVPLQCEGLSERLSGLKLITNELLPVLAEENLSDVFEHVMPCSNSIMGLLLDRVVDLVNSENHKDSGCTLQNIREYLKMALEVTQNIYNILEYINKNKVNVLTVLKDLPKNVFEIVLKIFAHCKESKNIYKNYFDSLGEIINLFKQGQEVNSKLISLLEKQLVFNNLSSEDEKTLEKVIKLLGEIGETVSGMNAKATLQTWKAYINLLQKHLDNAEECNVSISQPLHFFANEVKTNINLILELISNEPDATNLQQTLKITSFLVKIACKICTFQKNKNSYVQIISFLSTIYCFSPSYIEYKNYPENVINLLNTSVFELCDSLCRELFKDNKFHEILQDVQNSKRFINDDIKGYVVLIFFILDLIQNLNTKSEVKTSSFNLHKYIQLSFTLVDNEDDVFFEDLLIYSKFPDINNLYDVLVLKCALLFNCMTVDEVNKSENILLSEILSQNVGHALMATDVWISVISFSLPENSYGLLCNLVEKSFELFSVTFCERPESVLLGNFLSRIFSELPVNYKTKFVEKYSPHDKAFLWKYIKLSNIPQSSNIIDCLLRKFLENSKMLYSKNISQQEFAYLLRLKKPLWT
ncbi:uncharacterized protein LOC108734747 [Agrilus planipennis]|uniref:Uncharacterized protein LOC108734747 n=1 Tax=Agrilus planipennis TaxID=224129 RepID=A0A1W4WN74_AGRPL|nr:uncharacterized protein LOC108734747 [Agrilus planipennis]